MAIYQVQGPDGKIYEIEGPEGATEKQIVAEAQRLFSDVPQQSAAKPQKPVDLPTRVAQAGGVFARGVLGMPAMVMQAAQEAWNLTTPLQARAANALGYDRVKPEMLQF